MSGTNPFRRNDVNSLYNHAERDKRAIPPINTEVTQQARTKTTKTVRIISPHSASSDVNEAGLASEAHDVRLHSPPPRPSVSKGELNGAVPSDPFTVIPDDGESRAVDVTELANPFKRKTARDANTIEKPDGSALGGAQRAQFDVDGFKNLLLTGHRPSSTPSQSIPPVTFRTTLPSQESESASSARSPSSLLQRVPTPPLDLFDESLSSSDDESQNEADTDVGDKKPSAPEHRHGQPIKGRGPRLVSFEDPALSFSNVASRPQIAPDNGSISTSRDEQRQDTSRWSSAAHEPASDVATRKPEIQKKKPPAPPPSRRLGQSRPKSFIADTQSSSPILEDADVTPSSVPITSSKPAPPPPRRHGSVRNDSRSSVPTLASLASSPDSNFSGTNAVQEPSFDSPSRSSSKRHSTFSPHSGSPSMPPPPPPRRRGSSHSSHTPSRMSADYRNVMTQRERGDSSASSISQIQIPPSLDTTSQQSENDRQDPLDDLSALQREVDEYRERMGR